MLKSLDLFENLPTDSILSTLLVRFSQFDRFEKEPIDSILNILLVGFGQFAASVVELGSDLGQLLFILCLLG